MITEEDCFYRIEGSTQNIENYFNTFFDRLPWFEHESLWTLSLIPPFLLLENPALSQLNEKFEIEGAAFIRMDPGECYKWHLDFSRGVAINLLMNPGIQSLCMFETEEMNKERIKYLELDYQPHQFYLFNTQVNHSVITFKETRYMFTLQFRQTKEELTYYDVLDYWKSLTTPNKEV